MINLSCQLRIFCLREFIFVDSNDKFAENWNDKFSAFAPDFCLLILIYYNKCHVGNCFGNFLIVGEVFVFVSNVLV